MPQSETDWLSAESPDPQQANSDAEPSEVVRLLNGGGLYVRTGLLLLPQKWLGREGELAVKLGVSHVNYQQWKTPQIQAGQSFLMYTAERLADELDALCQQKHPRSTLLVSLLDLPLTALHPAERRKFWQFMYSAFGKRPRGLLLTLPERTSVLPDETDLENWLESRRLARWNN